MFAAKNEFFTPSQGYQISRSVRMRYGASAYLSRGMSTANTTTWTVSFWFKTSLNQSIGSGYGAILSLFESVETTGAGRQLGISQTNAGGSFQISFYKYAPSTYTMRKIPAMVFRDPSAWYHAVFVWNTTSAVAEDRAQIWINGVRVTAWTTNTNPAQNEAWLWSMFTNQFIGTQNRDNGTVLYPWDGYLTEVNFIDGQALTPTSFGQFNSVTGVWQPLKYTGTYGTNGFYLNFSDNSNNTATTIGKDYSGNGNNWTPNNISVTSGVTYDSMLDVPTLYADGGNGRGNYAVLNPVRKDNSQPTFSNANLTVAPNAAQYQNAFASIGVTTGKWYVEVLNSGTPNSANMIGVANTAQLNYLVTNASFIGNNAIAVGYGYYIYNGNKYTNGTSTSYGNSIASGDVVGIALDLDNGKIWFSKNGTWQASGDPAAGTNAAFTGIGSDTYFFGATNYSGGSSQFDFNFGQRPFTYTPPSGFVALNTQNLPAPTISNGALYMAATTYTGNGTSQTITNGGNNTIGTTFKPDFVWYKNRSIVASHNLFDSVRGVNQYLISDSTAAEGTASGVTAFNSNGFSVGSLSNGNGNGNAIVAWQWQAGAGTTSSNTSGSITSTVSVNATAGFSIVAYNSGASGDKTVGHGLGVAPSMIITKSRSSASYNWSIYHASVATTVKKYLTFTTDALQDNGTNIWGSAFPTSSVFGITSGNGVVASTDCIAYCFSAVAGYSAFGKYTSNQNSDGPFVYLGFRPRFLMIKRTDTAQEWVIVDTGRSTYNQTAASLLPNSSGAEGTGNNVDVTANGFKIRTSGDGINYGVGGTYIYACFAENPFKLALAR